MTIRTKLHWNLPLVVAVILAMLMVAVPATAGTIPVGTGMENAVDLAGIQSATLAPNSEFWYKFSHDGSNKVTGVLMNYTPAPMESNPLVTFKIWGYNNRAATTGGWPWAVIGQGTVGGSPVGVKYWRGGSFKAGQYYVQMVNGSSANIAYAITLLPDVNSLPSLPINPFPETGPAPVAPTPASEMPTPAPPPPTATPAVPAAPQPVAGGTGIEDAIPLIGTQSRSLAPGGSHWYQFRDEGTNRPLGVLLNYTPTPIESNQLVQLVIWTHDIKREGLGQYPYSVVGRGTIGDQPVGVKYWRGSGQTSGRTYYVQVVNGFWADISYAVAFIGDREKLPTLTINPAGPNPTPVPPAPTTPAAAPTPEPEGVVTPPTSSSDPKATYALGSAKVYGNYTVRFWRRVGPDQRSSGNIVTITGAGQSVQIEDVFKLNDLTGQDINKDGYPEAVIDTFTGGAHCCAATQVFVMGPTLDRILNPTPNNCGGTLKDLNGDGVYEYVTCDDLFAYAYCCYAGSPAVMVIMRYLPGQGYVPASPQFQGQYAERIAAHTQNAQQGQAGERCEWDNTNKCAVLPLVLDYLYSGQPDAAWAALYQYYPYPDVETFRAEIEQKVGESPLFVR